MKLKFTINDILVFVSLLTCFSSAPYLTHYLFGGSYVLFSGATSLLLLGMALHFNKLKYNDTWINIWIIFASSFFVYAFFMFVKTGELDDIRKFIGISTKVIFLIGSILVIQKNYNLYLKYFIGINAVIAVLSIILFFLLLLGFNFDPISFTKLDGRRHLFYWIGATNVYLNFADLTLIRIAGYADEPGAFALILTYLLVLNEITYRSSKLRILFVFSGFLSFSMAFIITLLPISIYWTFKKVLNIKFIILSLVLLFSLSLYIINTPSLEGIKLGVESLVFERFEKTSDGSIKGDNRSHAVPIQVNAFFDNPLFGVGANPDNIEKYGFGYPSFFSYLALHGIYGYLFFYIPFFYLCFKYRHKYELLLFFALFLNYMQRPSIEDMFSMICFTLIFYSYLFKKSLTTQQISLRNE